ncbi:glutamate-5-semialdehyde dehydrogenase [Micromonospora echinofusca]|uniref:Gamma-glutamyl phosphate reductase n=1 Tax=Micromonospora echinofusca TaxID=47858 RepID=A0ABS3VJG4_MICEH|nr:glutamate-5-semialdehyde dehydrogenase [Micromonospora echinofusca]MBO4204637.1 glutamate-5-semialdehyde dehydrogenase [Micromonospora echinofusca]
MNDPAIDQLLSAARAALRAAPPVGDEAYLRFARSVGALVRHRWSEIVRANEVDLAAGHGRGLPEPLLHRMRLTGAHRDRVAELAGTVQRELVAATRPGPVFQGLGGATARQVPRPLGVVLMIYEARPTVTVDGTLLPVCAGNAVLLRGGTEIAATNAALGAVFDTALAESGLPAGLVQVLTDVDRAGLRHLLRRDDAIDVLIPRGSPSLVDACRISSRIPMIVGGGGVNHQYVHRSADPDLAVRLVLDGKLPEPEGCTALEMVLLDDAVADAFLDRLARRVAEPDVARLALRVDTTLADRLPAGLRAGLDVRPLTDADDGREFLDTTLAVRTVSGLEQAVAHIDRYGSGHTEGIVTGDPRVADEFCRRVDAAALVVNGSVRLHDGPTLGLGTEIVIATGRLHVRGPVTLRSLTTRSWRVEGNGVTRFRAA